MELPSQFQVCFFLVLTRDLTWMSFKKSCFKIYQLVRLQASKELKALEASENFEEIGSGVHSGSPVIFVCNAHLPQVANIEGRYRLKKIITKSTVNENLVRWFRTRV